MNSKSFIATKKFVVFSLLLFLSLNLFSCKKKDENKYQNYVKSIIAINYIGVNEDYLKTTNANKKDADALYEANAKHLAENIIFYYGLSIPEDSQSMADFVALSKEIYSRANYKVSKAYKELDNYCVDVTIYPINILNQSHDQVSTFINDFNQKVSNGEYNDHSQEEYLEEYAQGLISILRENLATVTYEDVDIVSVKIIIEDKRYYISDEDLLEIDKKMIASLKSESVTPQ